MVSNRKFYKQEIHVVILTEEPWDDTAELADIGYEVLEGSDVLHSIAIETQEVDGVEMAKLLVEANSEPGFFMLTEDGEDGE